MALLACTGAGLACSMGAAPSALLVLPQNRVLATTPIANIMDNKPFVNVPPFGMCSSIANPAVAAATAAALGALTPVPCVPVTPAPWVPGAVTVLVGEMPALDMNAKLLCTWAGVISVTSPGQTAVLA
ncbi:DUF4280 domain-containing protein [Sorangium sp. So ce315]|uniref:DUF4280 domain-containing protein n=1 Tax=Sorangium sp. So ce315 TaxID=3133299 RepID=UPI003F5F8657